MLYQIIAIFLGGGLGSIARFAVSKGVLFYFKHDLPIGTFLANLLACLILGLALGKYEPMFSEKNFWFFFVVIGMPGGHALLELDCSSPLVANWRISGGFRVK